MTRFSVKGTHYNVSVDLLTLVQHNAELLYLGDVATDNIHIRAVKSSCVSLIEYPPLYVITYVSCQERRDPCTDSPWEWDSEPEPEGGGCGCGCG